MRYVGNRNEKLLTDKILVVHLVRVASFPPPCWFHFENSIDDSSGQRVIRVFQQVSSTQKLVIVRVKLFEFAKNDVELHIREEVRDLKGKPKSQFLVRGSR